MADHQNCGGFAGASHAGYIPLQHAWVYGEKATWCLNGSSVIRNNELYTGIVLDAVTSVFFSSFNIYTLFEITNLFAYCMIKTIFPHFSIR